MSVLVSWDDVVTYVLADQRVHDVLAAGYGPPEVTLDSPDGGTVVFDWTVSGGPQLHVSDGELAGLLRQHGAPRGYAVDR